MIGEKDIEIEIAALTMTACVVVSCMLPSEYREKKGHKSRPDLENTTTIMKPYN